MFLKLAYMFFYLIEAS